MDSDESSNPDDHGLNMDSVPASHDNPSMNSDSVSTNYDDPGIHTGPSSSQPLPINSRGRLRCVNCGLNVTRIRRHLLEIAEVRNIIQQWVQPQQVNTNVFSVINAFYFNRHIGISNNYCFFNRFKCRVTIWCAILAGLQPGIKFDIQPVKHRLLVMDMCALAVADPF